ncbi:hypothetical protein [Nocardia terpenica]|uniref:Uncharacterized protein n=1 Tax=Nocardia terpenica TaxID=455432 RepID=A0A164PLN5_9NOCA|nr:hypothetical protein [Nocardia terpenica]KZM75733.1 hypothetical protein AWN90_20565 [Nocardia terpenica]
MSQQRVRSGKTCFHLPTDAVLTPRRLAASAALISPASTDNTTRTVSSIGIFNRRDLATARLLPDLVLGA